MNLVRTPQEDAMGKPFAALGQLVRAAALQAVGLHLADCGLGPNESKCEEMGHRSEHAAEDRA